MENMVKRNSSDNFFRNISNDVVEDIFNLSDDEVRTEAKKIYEDSGKRVDTIRNEIESLIGDCHEERQKIWKQEAQKKRNKFSSKIAETTTKLAELSLNDIKEEIRLILISQGNNFALEYRNYEGSDRESLLGILSDLKSLAFKEENNEG